MAGGEVVVFASDLAFELANFLREKFHGTSTTGADHVMVAAAVVLMLVAGDAVVEGDFAGESALGEQFQGAIHGGIADAGVFFLDKAMKLLGGEVVAGFEKRAEDGVALRGLFEADVFEMAVEDILGFADHLPRDGGLIIDALLQHGLASQDITEEIENEIHSRWCSCN